MFSLEKIFVDLTDYLSQQHWHGVESIGVRSRRIQRSLRSIDAAQGGCWTAPCSPAVPAFGEIIARQPEVPVRHNARHAQVQSWRSDPLLPTASEQPLVTAADHPQVPTSNAAGYGCGLSSSESAQHDVTGSITIANTVPASRASSPLSSPPLSSARSSLLSPPPSSPIVDHSRDESALAEAGSRRRSDKVTAQSTKLQEESFNSELGREASGPINSQYTISDSPARVRSIAHDRFALQSWPTSVTILNPPAEDPLWTKRRLRSKPGQSGGPSQDRIITATVTQKGTKRKTSTSHESSAAADRTSPGPLVALVNQIGRTNTIEEIRETIQELKARPYHIRALAESLHNRTPIQIDTPAARIIQVTPNLVRDIEGSIFNEHLSRICHRLALADFYCAYRAAHAKPHVFLQELDRSQQSHGSRSRHQRKSGVIKERFIELVFACSTGERDRKKDSVRVNNWQKAGRPWFELINRFGTGILLLVPDEVTNRRLRDMRTSEFNNFLRLAEEREPVFRDVLAVANNMVKEGFKDHDLYPEPVTSLLPTLPPPPPLYLRPGSTGSAVSGSEDGVGAGDAYSGPALDTLLAFSFRQAAEGQQLNNIVGQCDLWTSTRFDDPNGGDGPPVWSPHLQRSRRRPRRYHLLPFYITERWQLAVFDLVKNIVICYDTRWTSGSPTSTFLSLQEWFNATVSNAQDVVFDFHHEKDTPVASTAKETVILTWWFARQLVDTNEVKNRSLDWRRESVLADHVLSDRGQTVDPTRGLLEEVLVSPSIYSDGGSGCHLDEP